MIYRMSCDLEANLRARKFPVHISYGKERMLRGGWYSASIVIERDASRSDKVGATLGQQRNPRAVYMRSLAVKALVFAKSNVDGARLSEHEHECETIVDGLVSALYEWATAARAGEVTWGECRYLSAEERDDIEGWPGVVYMLRFHIDRRITTKNYEGAGLSSAVLSDVITSLDAEP